MKYESFKRIVKLGLTNFWRNRWLSFTAIIIMALALLVVSIFSMANIVVEKATATIKSKMDISVYFLEDADSNGIASLEQKVAQRTDVKEVRYVSKEEALEIFLAQQKGKKVSEAISAENNPLPRSLEIKANKPEDLDAIANFLNNTEFKTVIDSISYHENKAVIDRLIGYTSLMRAIGMIFSIVFIFISILVILNTIRLTIFTRKDEIEIMRLVGANNSFINIPFIVEGFLYGVSAAIVSCVIIWVGIYFISEVIGKYLDPSTSVRLVNFFNENFIAVIGIQLVLGAIVGVGCSLFSIRKYLKI